MTELIKENDPRLKGKRLKPYRLEIPLEALNLVKEEKIELPIEGLNLTKREYCSIKVKPSTYAILNRLKELYEKSSMDETIKRALVSLIDRSIIELSQSGQEALIKELCQLRRELMPKIP